jgi:hypothetical protein
MAFHGTQLDSTNEWSERGLKTTRPPKVVWWVALVLACLGALGGLGLLAVPYGFWLVLVAYVLLAATTFR